MELARQQADAVSKVEEWLKVPYDEAPIFYIYGYAGTGKTFLAKYIAELVRGRTQYAAFTGKASLVLRSKGCYNARTLHSLLYKAERDEATGKLNFILNTDEDAPLRGTKLLIVDECSMVGPELGQDLAKFKIKTLVLGDPMQLPPVKGTGFFVTSRPDVMLDEIHRQAADNPIIQMSMNIRSGRGIAKGWHGESLVLTKDKMELQMLTDADQVLCGKNDTRRQLNLRIRKALGFHSPDDTDIFSSIKGPAKNEKLICLRNNRQHGLYNGSLWEVSSEPEFDGECYLMSVSSIDSDAKDVDIEVPQEFFNGTEESLDWKVRQKYDEFTFGHAITVHKSQGSQWDNVLIYNENRAFREFAVNWLYTAVTRAANKLTLVL